MRRQGVLLAGLLVTSVVVTGCTLGTVHRQPLQKPNGTGTTAGTVDWRNQAGDISRVVEAAKIAGVRKTVTLVLGNVAIIGFTDRDTLPTPSTPTLPPGGTGLSDPNQRTNQGGAHYSPPRGSTPAVDGRGGYGTPTAPGGQMPGTAPGTGTGTEVTGPGTTAAPGVGHTGIQFAFPDMSDKDRQMLSAIRRSHPEIVKVFSTDYPAYVQALVDIANYQASGHPLTDRWQELQVTLQRMATRYHITAPR